MLLYASIWKKKSKNCIFKYNYITCRMKKKSCNTVLNFIKNSLSKEIYLMLNLKKIYKLRKW